MIVKLLEQLHEKENHEAKLQEELEALKEFLKSEKQCLTEVTCDRDKLRSLCDKKDSALQVTGYVGKICFLILSHCLPDG